MAIYRYKVPFVKPVNTGRGVLDYREGFILESGNCRGEIAPLPGFSEESFSDVESLLKKIDTAALIEGADYRTVTEKLREMGLPIYSSLVFGLESLLMERDEENSLKYREGRVHCATLISSMDDYDGITPVVKMKAGRGGVLKDIELFRQLDSDERVKAVRIDPNRLWSFEDALQFISSVNIEKIEFIEEPFENSENFDKFYKKTGVKIGVDESVVQLEASNRLFVPSTGAVVIKPVITGGVIRSLELIRKCREHGVTPVVSSVYETGPGFSTLLKIAHRAGADIYHGLSTFRYIKERVVVDDFSVSGATLVLNPTGRVLYSRLEETGW